MSEPKRHHFLPVCYLSGFLNKAGQLSIYDRERQSYRSQRAESAAFEKYLYSWILPDGSKDHGLEKHFGKIEAHYPGVRKSLESGELLTQEELDPLLAFVALQLFRSYPKTTFLVLPPLVESTKFRYDFRFWDSF